MLARRTLLASLALGLTPALLAQVTPGKPMPANVHVAVDATGNNGTVPAHIFGTFIEPIDWSVNNGVMAQILDNPSLEAGLYNHAMFEPIFKDQPELIETSNQTGIPFPWQQLNREAGNRYELHVGQAANSWQSLEVMGLPDAEVGIAQRIYLPVPRCWKYTVALYAKHIDGPSGLTVLLRAHDGKTVFGSAKIDAKGSDWTRYTATIELKPGSVKRLEPVDFGVAVGGIERVELDQITLTPADAVDGLFDPTVLKLADDMHMTELRFGGNFSSYYHWRDGIGPLDKRVAMENIAWGIPEYNNFGTDEFLRYSELVHAEPQFDINEGSGSPDEAVEWIKYIRAKYKGPMIVEMGNELYGKWQVGYPTINQVGPRTLVFSKAIKPLLQKGDTLMATGIGPGGGEKWNAEQYRNPAGTFELLTMHFIVGTNNTRLKPLTPDFMAAAAYAVPTQMGRDIDKAAEQKNAAGHKDAHFAITEWLFNNKTAGERHFENVSPSSRNQGGAVMVALSFNEYMRHNSEIKLVDMTGLMEFAGIWKRKEQSFVSPPYYTFQLYSTAKNETVLPVTTDSGTYDVANGTPGYADVKDVPYIDVVATRSADGHGLNLFCVNRSLTADQPLTIDLKGFAAKGKAIVEQIVSKERLAWNTEENPDNVKITKSEMAISGKAITTTLPHESVMVIRLRN